MRTFVYATDYTEVMTDIVFSAVDWREVVVVVVRGASRTICMLLNFEKGWGHSKGRESSGACYGRYVPISYALPDGFL